MSKLMTGGDVFPKCLLLMRLLGKMQVAYISGRGIFSEDMSSRANVRQVFVWSVKCLSGMCPLVMCPLAMCPE